jgi:hypothetical protein
MSAIKTSLETEVDLGLAGGGARGHEVPDLTGVLIFCVVAVSLFVLPIATVLTHGPQLLPGFWQ